MIKKATKDTLMQYTATFVASITTMGSGCSMSWTSPALTYLTSEESYLPTTKEQSSWIASLMMLGLIIGYLLNPPLVNKTNRKKTLIIFGLAQASSWLLIILAKNIIVIYTARIIQGIGYGGGICSTTVYISEIGDRQSRGIFIVIMKCFISLGGSVIMILGASVTYQEMNLVLLTIPLIFVGLFSFMPNSSYFFEMNKKREQEKEEAEEVRMKLDPLREEVERGEKLKEVGKFENSNFQKGKDSLEIKDQILKIETSQNNFQAPNIETKSVTSNLGIKNSENKTLDKVCETSNLMKSDLKTNSIERINLEDNFLVDSFKQASILRNKTNTTRTFKSSFFKTRTLNLRETNLWRLFALPNNRRALAIIASLTCIIILSGYMAVVTFTEQIFTYKGSFLAPKTAAVVLKSVGLVTSLLGALLVERVKRRSLLLYSGMTLAVSIALVGLFFFLKENSMDVSFIEWLPLFGLTIFDSAFTVGIGTLFYIYQGELLAIEVKSEGITFVKILYMTLVFLFLLKFQPLLSGLGFYMTFWMFALGSALSTYVTYIIAPETKGKSFDEIQILLMPSSGNVKIK